MTAPARGCNMIDKSKWKKIDWFREVKGIHKDSYTDTNNHIFSAELSEDSRNLLYSDSKAICVDRPV